MKKTLLMLAILTCISYASISQTTYYFRGATGNATGGETDWISATNWTTNSDGSADALGGRTTSATTDVLIIDGDILNTLNSSRTLYLRMSKDVCGTLTIKSSAIVYFSSFSGGTTDVVAASGITIGTTTSGVLNAVTGGTNFTSTLKVGDYVSTTGTSSSLGQVLSIVNDNSMTITNDYALSGTALYRIPTLSINSTFTLESGSTIHMGTNVNTAGVTQNLFCLKLESGSSGAISGSVLWNRNGSSVRLVAVSAGSLVFQSGSNCTFQANPVANAMGSSTAGPYLGSALGTGTAGSDFAFTTSAPPITFSSNSTFTFAGTAVRQYTPFGRGVAVSGGLILTPVVNFQPGSNYLLTGTTYNTGMPYFFSNVLAKYGNLTLTSAIPTNISAGYIDTLRILTGTTLGNGTIHLYGSLYNNTASSTISSSGTVFFSGSANQTIGGSSTGSFTFATLYNRNTVGVTLSKNITVTSLLGLLGKIDVGNFTITGSGTPSFVSNNATNRTYNQPSGSNQVSGGVKTTANSTAFLVRGINNSTVLIGAAITSSSHPSIFPAGTYVTSYSTGGNFTASNPATITADSTSTPTLSLTFTSTEGTVITANTGGLNSSFPSFTTYTLNNSTNYTFNGTNAQITGALLPLNINNLTINNAAGVTLSGNDTVKGTLAITSGSFNTGSNNFSLGASATATIAPGARLNSNGGVTDFNNRSVTVQANSTAVGAIVNTGTLNNATNVTLQQWVTGQRGYRILSNPFSTDLSKATIGTANGIIITGINDVKTYNTSTNSWSNNISTIAANTPYSVFIRGLASEVSGLTYTAGPTAFAYNVTGALNGTSVTLNQDNSSATAWTIAGNPFAAPIKSSALTGGTAGTPYYIYSMAQNNTGARVKAGGWVADSSNSSTITRIPMMGVVAYQAGTGAAATFNVLSTSIDTASANAIQTGLFGEGDATTQLELQLHKDGNYQDKLFVRFDANSTAKGSERMDLRKLDNDVTNIYTITSDKVRLAVDARKGIDDIIPVGVTSTVGKYSFTVASNNFVNASNVYLVDKLLNTKTALEPGATYSFEITSDAATQGDNRFELGTVKTQVQDAVVSNDNFSVKVLGNVVNNAVKVQVRGAKASSVQISVIDMQGKIISNTTSSREVNNLSLANGSGMYLIKVTDGENSIISKVVKP